jgi:hypothetical protein
MSEFLLCSNCFRDQGLRLDAEHIGIMADSTCPNCGSTSGMKLTAKVAGKLAHRFFVWGTLQRCDFGASPSVQFNQHQRTRIKIVDWLKEDIRLFENMLGVGFFYYGPRLWMIGEVEPLKALQTPEARLPIIQRILTEYPTRTLQVHEIFYRIRKGPKTPDNFPEYDSPPVTVAGSNRFDSPDLPVMYGSQDLHVCIHECRVTAEDELYVATLSPTVELNLLDLSAKLRDQNATEFDSLDMAIHMLFLAGNHSYPISREIARVAHTSGFDGIIYPSYFSLIRTGAMPFETAYGLSLRRFPEFDEYEKSKIIPNLALFGRPIENRKIQVRCINRLILNRVEYGIHFGPVGCQNDSDFDTWIDSFRPEELTTEAQEMVDLVKVLSGRDLTEREIRLAAAWSEVKGLDRRRLRNAIWAHGRDRGK